MHCAFALSALLTLSPALLVLTGLIIILVQNENLLIYMQIINGISNYYPNTNPTISMYAGGTLLNSNQSEARLLVISGGYLILNFFLKF